MAKDIADLTNEDIDEIWADAQPHRDYMAKRQRYYDGQHDILDKNETHTDGTPKAEVVTNWCGYIVNRYTGAFTPYQVTSDIQMGSPRDTDLEQAQDTEQELELAQAGIQYYNDLARDENLESMDIENRRQALINGISVEVHSFDGDEINITQYNPIDWVFLYEDDKLYVAVYQKEFESGQVLNGQVLENPVTLRVIYDESTITVYTQESTGQGERSAWTLWDQQTHQYEQVPVVVTTVDADMQGILSDAIMAQNDEYNEIDSASGDSVRLDVDSLLKLTGVDGNWVQAEEDTIRNKRILPLPADDNADAEYLTRTFDNERTELRLSRTRKNILMMGEVPDVNEIVGTSGATSGIALKLMFTPMEERASSMIPLLKESMDKRIDLINTIQTKRNGDAIINPEVNIQFKIPVNRIEEWKSISALNGIVSHKTQLKLLSDVQDPETEQATIVREREQLDALRRTEEINLGEERAEIERRSREITEAGDVLIAGIEPTLNTLSERITQAVQSGLIKAQTDAEESANG